MISKMLEQAGFAVDLQILDAESYNRQTFLSHLEQPPERYTWDIALGRWIDLLNFPVLQVYTQFALDGVYDWLLEKSEFRQLYAQVMGTVDRERQQQLIRQMERHTREQAYFLFLYNPIQLYAVHKDVQFIPYVNRLDLAEIAVTDQHWSVRKQKATVHE